MWLLLEQAGVFDSSFSPNGLQMAFSEGNRNFGLKMLNQIHSCCSELYTTMLKEQRNGRVDADAERTEQ